MTEAETIADRIWDIGAYMAELEEVCFVKITFQ